MPNFGLVVVSPSNRCAFGPLWRDDFSLLIVIRENWYTWPMITQDKQRKLRRWYAKFNEPDFALQAMIVAAGGDCTQPVEPLLRPEVLRAKATAINARARSMGARGRVTAGDLGRVYARSGGACARCGTLDNIQVDHIVPYCRNGTNYPHNLQTLCQTCNLRKARLEDRPS